VGESADTCAKYASQVRGGEGAGGERGGWYGAYSGMARGTGGGGEGGGANSVCRNGFAGQIRRKDEGLDSWKQRLEAQGGAEGEC
jgi:hypothetical protein